MKEIQGWLEDFKHTKRIVTNVSFKDKRSLYYKDTYLFYRVYFPFILMKFR